jgi:ribose transport system ATP-binding protein
MASQRLSSSDEQRADPGAGTALETNRQVALRLDHVTKVFPGVKALDDVSLTVYAGEVHGIVGENGAGKSTLMAVASGALVPEIGGVEIQGTQLTAGSTKQAQELGISIVHQEPALLPDLSVAENLYLGVSEEFRPSLMNVNSWAEEQLKGWSSDIAIDPSSRIEELGAEHRFIVDIVRSLAMKPSVLVLDEPTEHLAGEDVERLFAAIRERVADDAAVIYISHRIHEVKEIAENISVLCDGQRRGTSPAAELTERDIVGLIVGRKLEAVFPDKLADAASRPSVLRVDNLRGKGFDNVSFDLRAGEIVGLAGIEGNGQRELLRSIGGLGRHRGKVALEGRTLRGQTSDQIAYLPGDRHREGIFPDLTVRETIGLRNFEKLAPLGVISPWGERELTEQAVRDLGVKTPSIETTMESLSGGNQQKALLAGVVARNPKVLLCDEPTQGVDVGAKAEIYQLLRDAAARNGMGILVVSSDALELAGLCDRVLIFSRGQVVAELSSEDSGPAYVSESNITESILTATTHRLAEKARTNPIVRWLAGDLAPLALVALAVFLLGLYTSGKSSFYLQDVNIETTLALVATLGFVAMGQTIALMVGAIDLSVGPLMGFIVVVESFYLVEGGGAGQSVLGWALLIAIPIALGVINWTLADLVKLNSIVATLITYIALQALSLVIRPIPGGTFSSGLTEAIKTSIGPIPVAFIVLVAVGVVLSVALKKSRFGVALRAVGSNPDAARLNGLPTAKLRLAAFILCGLFAAVAAIMLISQVGSGDPKSGVNYTLISISAAVIGGASIFGGRGSFIATVAGALLVTQATGAVVFLGLNSAWSWYLPGGMTLLAVAIYSKSRQITVRAQ